MSKKNRQQSRDIISLIYTRSGSCLYGCIQFFRPNEKQDSVGPFRHSAPFVISQSIRKNETIVYGSVYGLIQEIRRLLDDLSECNEKFNSTLRLSGVNTEETRDSFGKRIVVTIPEGEKGDKLFCEYVREVTNILLLLSSQTRNLFQLYPRFNKHCISQFDYEGNKVGSIPLKELFDYFVHNRYLFVDGEYVRDLFSDKFSSKSSISQKFMGYKISWREYIDAIRSVTDDVTMKDLTGLLRGRLKKLSSNSSHKDIVFLVQNLESFSNLLAIKIPDKRYTFMLNLMFDERVNRRLVEFRGKKEKVEQVVTTFTAPHIKIHEELSEKKFAIRVRCKFDLGGNSEKSTKEEELENHRIDVNYEQFFDRVNSAFGNDSLLNSV